MKGRDMTRDEVVKELSTASGPRGDILLRMLDECGVQGLIQVTDEQANDFYERWKAKNASVNGGTFYRDEGIYGNNRLLPSCSRPFFDFCSHRKNC